MTEVARRALLAIIVASVSLSGHTAELIGYVVRIADGDTVTVLDENETQHRVRLAAIDAPERRQAFGQVSKQHLADMVFKRQVRVDWHKTDRYSRLIGKIFVDGVDAGLAQIEAGLAWHYTAYAAEQSDEDRAAYAAAHRSAEAAGRGLWNDPQQTAPWSWRRQRSAAR